jgi:tRNA 2-thiouridine synthesizing protein E
MLKGGRAMTSLLDAIKEAESETAKDARFPHAPADWTRELAAKTAQREGLKLGEDHWEAVRALQQYYAKHEEITINMRELHDALDEKFHGKGGMKYLYQLFRPVRWRRAASSPGSRRRREPPTRASVAWFSRVRRRTQPQAGAGCAEPGLRVYSGREGLIKSDRRRRRQWIPVQSPKSRASRTRYLRHDRAAALALTAAVIARRGNSAGARQPSRQPFSLVGAGRLSGSRPWSLYARQRLIGRIPRRPAGRLGSPIAFTFCAGAAYRRAPVALVSSHRAQFVALLIAVWSSLFFGEVIVATGWLGILVSVGGLLLMAASAKHGDSRRAHRSGP